LAKFKDVVREYSILNCKEIRFEINESERTNAVCSQGCGFRIHVS